MLENPHFDRSKPQSEDLSQAILGRLETILRRSSDVDSFDAQCSLNGLYPNRVAQLLSNPEYSLPLLDNFVNNPFYNRYQLAIAGSRVPFELLSDRQKKFLNVVESDSSLSKQVFHPFWDLCYRSEDYMRQALNKNESLLILNNGTMLAKSKGYKTILALQTVADDQGMVVAGNWYSPEGEAKQIINNAFLNKDQLATISTGKLVLMRSIADGKAAIRVFERAYEYTRGGNFGRSKIETIRDEIRKAL